MLGEVLDIFCISNSFLTIDVGRIHLPRREANLYYIQNKDESGDCDGEPGHADAGRDILCRKQNPSQSRARRAEVGLSIPGVGDCEAQLGFEALHGGRKWGESGTAERREKYDPMIIIGSYSREAANRANKNQIDWMLITTAEFGRSIR
jgi:hypothetical protein